MTSNYFATNGLKSIDCDKMTSVNEYVPEATMIALESMTCLFLSTLRQYRKINVVDTTSNHRRQTTSGPYKNVRDPKNNTYT